MLPSFPYPVRPRFLLIAVVILAVTFPSTAQPRLVKDINVQISPVGSAPAGLRSIGNVTFFYANDPLTGYGRRSVPRERSRCGDRAMDHRRHDCRHSNVEEHRAGHPPRIASARAQEHRRASFF